LKKEKFEDILEALEDDENSTEASTKISDDLMQFYNKVKHLENYSGIQMRLPYEITIN
jgi:hypothetical protein